MTTRTRLAPRRPSVFPVFLLLNRFAFRGIIHSSCLFAFDTVSNFARRLLSHVQGYRYLSIFLQQFFTMQLATASAYKQCSLFRALFLFLLASLLLPSCLAHPGIPEKPEPNQGATPNQNAAPNSFYPLRARLTPQPITSRSSAAPLCPVLQIGSISVESCTRLATISKRDK